MTAPGPRRGVTAAAVLALALLGAAAALAVVAARGPEPARTLEQRVQEVADTLRCPVCQNLSVGDSPSRTAQQMRARIEEGLRAGRSPEQVRADFAASYGEWILLAPPRRGFNLVAWIAPAVLVLAGLAAGGIAVRRWTAGGGPAEPAPTDPAAGPAAGDHLSPGDRRLLERALGSRGDRP